MISCSMIHLLIGAVWLCMHEGVAAAHRLLEADEDLAVGEVVGARRDDVDAELLGDLVGELGVRPAGEEHELLLARRLDAGHCLPLTCACSTAVRSCPAGSSR